MIPSHRDAGKCIYCAFRAQQLALRSRRLGKPFHTSVPRHERAPIRYTNRNEGSKFRFVSKPDRRQNDQHRLAAENLGKVSEDSVVRKYIKGRLDEVSPREKQQQFSRTLAARLEAIKDELKDAPLLEQLSKERADAGEKQESFSKIWRSFSQNLTRAESGKIPFFGETETNEKDKRLMADLKEVYRMRGENGLDDRIKYAFYGHVTGARFTKSDIRNQEAVADLRYPSEWFPATRSMHRTIHLHVGPTNSGKTYHALQRLEQASNGVYAGPLRLLAHEVYTRMNAKGKSCSLITGEERRMADKEADSFGDLAACTVEMMPLNKTLDVAVIDEIQMIGNKERGWAWTQALLGVKAKEVHLCGEERTVPLIRELCASVGEKLEIHRYERLSPLKVMDHSLDGQLSSLRKGDCVVSFSVMGIHALRKQIEQKTGKKVATVYGSLPPETRAQQARLFNDPNNEYDYLVASDAVGMGLNLAIKRIIFEASSKFDGYQRRTLGVADIKQIAGRAGRYRTAAQDTQQSIATQDLAAAKGHTPRPPSLPTPAVAEENIGLVTTLEKFDFPIVSAAMASDPEAIRTAGLFPPGPVLERFASYFPPSTPFSYILTRLHELSQMHTRFHLCGLKDQVWLADLIEPVTGLTITDRNIICSSPASKSDVELWRKLMPAMASAIAEQREVSIADLEELPLEVLEAEVSVSREYLRELERLHKGIVTYLWLSYRFAGIFSTRGLAFYTKGLVEEKIEDVLRRFSFSEAQRKKLAEKREKETITSILGEEVVDEEEGGVEDGAAAAESEVDDGGAVLVGDAEAGQASLKEEVLEQQTTLTSGGDHFGGEEDLAFEEPVEPAEPLLDSPIVEEEEVAKTASFAQWRERQTRGENQGTKEVDGSGVVILGDAVAEGEEKGLKATRRFDGREQHNVRDVVLEEEAAAEDSGALSAGPDLHDQAVSIVTETELDEDQPPIETRETAAPLRQDRTGEKPAGQNQFGGIPPKHLGHLDVNATEIERNVASRP